MNQQPLLGLFWVVRGMTKMTYLTHEDPSSGSSKQNSGMRISTTTPIRRPALSSTEKGEWLPISSFSLIEHFFPGWALAVCQYEGQVRPEYLSRNSVDFWGFTDDELALKTCNDLHQLIHPDDFDPYLKCKQRIRELQTEFNENEFRHYRFSIHYRLRRHSQYRSVHEEHFWYMSENTVPIYCTLYRDTLANQASERVQLNWYRTHSLGFQRIGSYAPIIANQELTVREGQIIQLIKEGFSSKEIADKLSISINTVRNHRANLFRKTKARNMVDLANNIVENSRKAEF